MAAKRAWACARAKYDGIVEDSFREMAIGATELVRQPLIAHSRSNGAVAFGAGPGFRGYRALPSLP
jgi:hypothetical protein